MRILWEDDLGALPVVNDEGQPVAVITDRDVAVAAYTQGRPLSQIRVHTAMSRALHTVHVSDKLSTAERVMRTNQVRRLPVVDESTRLVGMLALADIAQLESRAGEQLSTDVGAALAAISRPRRTEQTPPPEESSRRSEPRSSMPRETVRAGVRASGYGASSSQARR